MEELRIDDEATKEIFVGFFREGNLVPILGAGFTKGMPAKGAETVQSGRQLKQYMIKKIMKKQEDFSSQEMEAESFSTVAELFESNYADVGKTEITDYFHSHFTDVKINKAYQLRFLNEIDWEYIYTLNVDTGIEDSDRNRWEVFYPNKEFDESKDYGGRKKLYKIHGDARRFVKTSDYNEMILTESQYIRSLNENQKFHDMLSSDCESKNILYIGCSLDDEIDIKYSVLSDKNRNYKERETYRIYVTAENVSPLKKAKLESFNLSHYIQLQTTEDYELFYEFLTQCYSDSLEGRESCVDALSYQTPQRLGRNTKDNIKYLADIKRDKKTLPYYYFERGILNTLRFDSEKVNVIVGRRFVGKTMLAYNLLEHYQKYQRYFITAQESIDVVTIRELMELKNSLIVFDSDSVDDRSFVEILNTFEPKNGNLVCIFINSYDDVLNLVSYHTKDIHQPINHTLVGKMPIEDIEKMNKRLDDIGISKFNADDNILDNTLRIANVYKEKIVADYAIESEDELVIIIWNLVQTKMYHEEIVSLGLSKKYMNIVKKFAPFLQEEKCKGSEIRKKHSAFKIVCNGKLGLLQILNNYAYPQDDKMGNAVAKTRHGKICNSIYHIMCSFDRVDKNVIKKFIMFDTLNDIFSSKYSQSSINYIASGGGSGKSSHGAARLIQEIYDNEKIQKLEAADPNYWLQRAKSIYIMYRKQQDIEKLRQGIQWAIKAEQDSEIYVKQGMKQYARTMSNATIQIAIMYGRVAKLNKYSIQADNYRAIEYYYKGLSDSNNIEAARSLINHSKGKEDFDGMIGYLVENARSFEPEWREERDYLIKVSINKDMVYSDR